MHHTFRLMRLTHFGLVGWMRCTWCGRSSYKHMVLTYAKLKFCVLLVIMRIETGIYCLVYVWMYINPLNYVSTHSRLHDYYTLTENIVTQRWSNLPPDPGWVLNLSLLKSVLISKTRELRGICSSEGLLRKRLRDQDMLGLRFGSPLLSLVHCALSFRS